MRRVIDSRLALTRAGLGLIALLPIWIASCDREAPSAPGASPTAQAAESNDRTARIAQLEAELESARIRQEQSDKRLDDMRAQLTDSEARRLSREREWAEYSILLSKVSPERLPGGKNFGAEPTGTEAKDAEAAEAAATSAEALAADPVIQARSLHIARALRTLFTLEQIRGLDLLECGTLEGNAIGPVVLRLLDGQGRFAGSLYAARLRMEASRSARSLTLVLEDGYETRAGQRIEFEPSGEGRTSARRIVLQEVDPKSWVDDFRELFGEKGLDLSGDDGLWDLIVVKQSLNDLLKTQTAGGVYRLRTLGGVQDGSLLEVHLERLDERGDVERRLFADRMKISRAANGVELALESGVQVRGEDERVPFLDGRYRILLPSADAQVWISAGIPGLAEPKERAESAPVLH
ncbi:MAG TPA: hypothetical protein VK843_03645 [Planctomycetota bacterium]|nr:hypothetical protein [Planctomycetota bacterium]